MWQIKCGVYANLYYILTIHSLLITNVIGQRPSPCPAIFKYETIDPDGGQWTGVVSLTTQEELSGVWLHVGLDHQANVLINWFGESTTRDNKAFVIKNPTRLLKPGDSPLAIRFRMQYDATSTVPSLIRLRLNGRTICSVSETVTVSTDTTTVFYSEMVTEKSSPRRPPKPSSRSTTTTTETNVVSKRNSSSDNYSLPKQSSTASEYFVGDFNLNRDKLTGLPQSSRQPTLSEPTSTAPQCGRAKIKPRPLITYGQNSSDGEWPWHLAIYFSQGVSLNYICGGSVVSSNYVVTAAHCVTRPRTKELTNLSGLLLYLGTTNLKQFGPGIQVHQIMTAHVHPDYNPINLFNDVALLKLQRPAEFTDYVRPICLWEDAVDVRDIESKLGTVVGWGYDENNQITDNLMHIRMPIVSLSTCIYSNREFFSTFTFEKNYCAGYRNGTSVCNGDSGGGMYFPKSNDPNSWQLRGLVSIGVALQGQSCNPSQYVIFTDLAKHLDWIKETMQ